MWIRSQDKDELVEVKNGIVICWMNENAIDVNGHIVGEYNSKERALEELDDIQRALYNDLINGITSIYQMSKD